MKRKDMTTCAYTKAFVDMNLSAEKPQKVIVKATCAAGTQIRAPKRSTVRPRNGCIKLEEMVPMEKRIPNSPPVTLKSFNR
mmetsp:Transcript_151260/g.267873  ORF Transcript_151260/g.267873 Transcript_151260/m.267873 type:complete len:81 (-) Transcript_151260:88-330(-)